MSSTTLSRSFMLSERPFHDTRPRWMGIAGLVVSVVGFVAMFRNVTSAVTMIAEVNNLVLPIWLVVLGVVLLRARRDPRSGALEAQR